MTGERRSDASASRPADAAGPAYAGIWVALSAFVTFVVTGPFLFVLALVPGALGALAAAWTVRVVRRRARRTGKGSPADVIFIILAGLLPAILLYGSVVLPIALGTLIINVSGRGAQAWGWFRTAPAARLSALRWKPGHLLRVEAG